MTSLLLISLLIIKLAEEGHTIGLPAEALLNFTQLVEREGPEYSVEVHAAHTVDGYVLGVHRLRRPGVAARRAAPVLIMHGFSCSSEDFIRMGNNRSIGYLLADSGYDVWIGNFRGNLYTSHEVYSKKDQAFWNFSLDEHGRLDTPAIINAVLRATGSARVHYIGYSMGTTSYFIMCSARPEMTARVASFTGLAPVAAIGPRYKTPSYILINSRIARKSAVLHLDPLVFTPPHLRNLIIASCSAYDQKPNFCMEGLMYYAGEDYDQVDWAKHPVFIAKLQPGALRLLEHYSQVSVTDVLSAFDYGRMENKKMYGQATPPPYDLTANRAPAAIFYGENDLLATSQNSKKLIIELTKTSPEVHDKAIPYEKFNHLDFLYAKNIDALLNNDIVQMMNYFSQKYN